MGAGRWCSLSAGEAGASLENTTRKPAMSPLLRPFPGLRPFRMDEAHLFFGREGQSDELVRKLASHRFLAVVGGSGGGKSSLVKAGLLPTLLAGYLGEAGAHWRFAEFHPGHDPLGSLATALSAVGL